MGGNSGQGGRFLYGSSTLAAFTATVTGAFVSTATSPLSGPTDPSLFVAGNPSTPLIPELVNGTTPVAEGYGLTTLSDNLFSLSPSSAQSLVVELASSGPGSYSNAFPGYSYLFVINDSDKLNASYSLIAPQLGVGESSVPLKNGGWIANPTFVSGSCADHAEQPRSRAGICPARTQQPTQLDDQSIR